LRKSSCTRKQKVKIMRTKTLLLSALLGALGSVSVHAQNVYSLNVVGYINAVMEPGWTILTCPLNCTDTNGSPNNSIANLLNNSAGAYQSGQLKAAVYQFTGGVYSASDVAGVASGGVGGWQDNGTITLNPGQAVFFFNPFPLGSGSNMTATFVGTVPSGSQTNALIPGYNLVGSIVPATGDIVTNSITLFTNAQRLDYIYSFDSDYNGTGQVGFTQNIFEPAAGGWQPGDPSIANVYNGFFYWNNTANTNNWVENYSVSQ